MVSSSFIVISIVSYRRCIVTPLIPGTESAFVCYFTQPYELSASDEEFRHLSYSKLSLLIECAVSLRA